MVCAIFITALLCPMTSIAKTDYSYKIDSVLAEKLKTMNDNDTISVSIWFKDIDHEQIEAEAIEKVKGTVSKDVQKIACANEKSDEILEFSNKESKKSIEEQKKDSLQMQKFIEIKRKISSEVITKNNNKNLKEINEIIGRQNRIKTIYICKYVPNIDMYLTKKQIYTIVELESVTDVYFYDTDLKILPDDDISSDLIQTRSNSPTDTTYFDVTGISQARAVWGLGGTGIKIGVFDYEFKDPNNVNYFHNTSIHTTNVEYTTWSGNDLAHGNVVSSLIAGRRKNSAGQIDYLGAVPSASLYWASYTNDENSYKNKFEALSDLGCNIINMCVSMPSTVENNNTYGAVSKWFDYFALAHSITLVFSAGNKGAGPNAGNPNSGVTVGKMSHDAIVVGNCDNSGTIHSTSSYNISTTLPFKPDVVAPGTLIETATGGTFTGTTCSAPMVTGAVAQLLQVSAVLRHFPTLMKSLVLSSSKRTNDMISNNLESIANQSSIVMSRPYGCGMLNVINMYESFNTFSRYKYGTLSGDGEASFSKNVSVNGTKQLRAAATWNKTFGLDKTKKDIFEFRVTCPNGTVYKTQYNYDTKALLSFPTSSSGTYTFELKRKQTTGEAIDYAISFHLCVE